MQVLTPQGRVSIKHNEVNTKYDSRYHSLDNKRTLLGLSLSLGRACSVVAMAMYGLEVPLEEAEHEQRLDIFKSAAYYALSEDELEEILSAEHAALKHYLKGLMVSAMRLPKYVLPVQVRHHFQNVVFHPPRRDPQIQEHLGLEMTQTIFDA